MSVDNKVPEIRFKGFGGEWEEKMLSTDIAEIIGGGTPSTSISEFWDGDIDWYSPTEIGENVYAEGSQKKITPLGLKSCSAKILPAGNTVLFTSRAGIGDMAILTKPGSTNQGFQSLIVKEGYSPYFIFSAGKQIKDFALKHASGTTFLEISGKQLGRMKILMPSLEEQTAIGNYFQKLDALISQHQQKHEKLSSIKNSMLEKMFPKQGETMPEIRFKGFGGEWEERDFSNIATRVSTHHQSTCLPCVEYEDIVAGKGRFNKDIHQKKTFKTGLKFEADDVLFGKLRPYLKNWFLADFEGLAVGDFWVLRADNVASTFLFFLIQTNKFELISNLSAGSKMPRSDWGLVSYSCFFVPKNIYESIEIGNYFKKLDNLINQHQQQITKLNNIKQACLSEMFV